MSTSAPGGIRTTGVSELVLEVADLAASERFYAGILGLPVVARWEQRQAVWVLAGSGTRIGLWTPQVGIAGGRGGAHVHFAVHVDESDFPEIVERLRSHGLEVHVERFDDTQSDAAYVTDPDGNVVELWTWDVSEYLRDSGANAQNPEARQEAVPPRVEPTAGRPQAPPSYGFGKNSARMLPWSHAVERLKGARYYWLATIRPDGRPHATPLWGVWVDDALYFDGLPSTRWARNLAANPHVSVHLDNGDDVVILEGAVEDLSTDVELGTRIVEAWTAKYGRLEPDPAGSGILRLRPRSARAWSSESLEDGTRWSFSD